MDASSSLFSFLFYLEPEAVDELADAFAGETELLIDHRSMAALSFSFSFFFSNSFLRVDSLEEISLSILSLAAFLSPGWWLAVFLFEQLSFFFLFW